MCTDNYWALDASSSMAQHHLVHCAHFRLHLKAVHALDVLGRIGACMLHTRVQITFRVGVLPAMGQNKADTECG